MPHGGSLSMIHQLLAPKSFSIVVAVLGLLVTSSPAAAQEAAQSLNAKAQVVAEIDAGYDENARIALQIWNLAELGYQEVESTRILKAQLAVAGFEIESGVAGIPTAFVASWGNDGPVIGVLAEYDALPGITQTTSPSREAHPELPNGHACGHHLFGTGSVAAAIAVKNWLEASGTPGTIRLYGTPAEEGGAGKVYMVRAGLFDDVETVIHWHPSDKNDASPSSSLANRSAKFRFHGVSTHAAREPHRGRSALDGVEAMNFMVNLLREHVPQETRIHYVITSGGLAPNVVPDFAEVFYYVRHPDAPTQTEIWNRVIKAAEAAAAGTETAMDYELIHGIYNVLPNEVLALKMYENLKTVGGVVYTAEETAFGRAIQSTYLGQTLPLGSEAEIQPFIANVRSSSTDVGDVSWMVPSVGLGTATWVPGSSAHSWQAIAAGGTDIGIKGMQNAAKTMAMTAVDLFQDPTIIDAAKAEFEGLRGENFEYVSLLGDRDPPLDYRK